MKRTTCLSVLGGVFLLCALFAPPASAQAPTFTKAFSPFEIGSGSISTLQFTIASSGVGARDLAFTDNLPAGMTIADPASAATDCGGALTASAGGTSITLSGGQVAGGASCTVSVNVTSSTPGTVTNTSGDLTSSAGNSGPASANLTVATDRPSFFKSFAPSTVFFGGRSTLTLTVDNSANGALATNLLFTDNLPSGMEIAGPNNLVNTCGGNLIAPTGGSTISLTFGAPAATVAANSTCSISVDVVGNSVGTLVNTTGDLTSTPQFGGTRSSGKATAALTVNVEQVALTKEFTDDPVAPGDPVTVRFTVRNLDRRSGATDIAFTDDLDATLSGLAATGLPANPCGSGSSLSGSSVLSLSGGNLGAEGTCTFDVTLQVPAGAAPGTYTNTTSAITANVGGSAVGGNPASDILVVSGLPVLTKTFLDNPVAAGETTRIEFTVTNNSGSTATDISFTDELTTFLPFPVGVVLPAAGFCGGSSSLTLIFPGTERQSLFLSGGELAAGADCTFEATVTIPLGLAAGTYTNTTDAITATIDGETVTGGSASADFDVVAAPAISKTFLDDPVAAGATVVLEFTLTMPGAEGGADGTDIAFTDDLTATLAGLTAIDTPKSNVCGGGSEISGTTNLSFSGGSLTAGESCTFSVTLQVPTDAPSGSHTNTTSNVMATVLGLATQENGASDDLDIVGLILTKDFTNDPVLPGGTVTLQFEITNSSQTAATDMLFTDSLSSVLSNLVGTGLPLLDVCGVGSSLTGANGDRLLIFSGGSLGAGESCAFSVVLQVPASALPGIYTNATSLFSATLDGGVITFDNAVDALEVSSDILDLNKEFIDDPVAPGGTATLRFTLSNLSTTDTVSSIAFTDNLDATLTGLAATGLPVSACGGTASGSGVISFSGGSLAAGANCSFDVSVSVPATAEGTSVVNTTSEVTGILAGLPVTGVAASDTLTVLNVSFSKAFADVGQPGGTVDLSFTIENVGSTTLTDLGFGDDLNAVIPGLAAIGLPLGDVCGEGSEISGTTLLNFSGGSLLPGGSCTITVTVEVPVGTEPGDYENVTTDLLGPGGAPISEETTAILTVIAVVDSDGDGVLDDADVCADTVIPEGVPTVRLGVNRFALVDGDGIFDTTSPNGNGPRLSFTIEDTAGCSCEQIIEALDLGKGHEKFGCSPSAMLDWVKFVSKADRDAELFRLLLRRPGTP